MDPMRMEMLKMWRSSWQNYLKTLTMMHEQGEKMLDLFLGQSDALRAEAKKLIKDGMDNAKQARDAYVEAVEENLKNLEEIFFKK